jgi:hypothetical protein
MKRKQLFSAILIVGLIIATASINSVYSQSSMKKDDKKSMNDTTKMKKGMMHDSKKDMKHDHMKMKSDSTKMKKDKM